jgi:hypothetical protein
MPTQLSQLLARAYPALKGLSLEIEIGCWWCGWTEHYLEGELLIVFNFLDSVEGDTARGTTTLVYLQLHSSFYTGTVHVLSRVVGIHPLV